MEDKMFDELVVSIKEAGDIRKLLRVARAAEKYHTYALYYAPWSDESAELDDALEALPAHLRGEG